MSAVAPDRGASPLMSNNPFRNKIHSHISPEPSPRPISTNPFLDITEVNQGAVETNHDAVTMNSSVNKATDAFSQLEVTDTRNDLQKTRSRQANGGPQRPDHPSLRGFPPPPGHRPANSDEARRRHQPAPRRELDIFADPFEPTRPRDRERKPRRNSESSVREKPSMDPEEERRRRERKYRESKRDGSKSSKPKNKKLDVIDKLDVTSIYGTGLFHHDGPFDACNPHRNRKRERYAPMQAFPKDSINMVMGGSGPVNKRMDYDKYHGRGEEAHRDYNEAAIAEDNVEPYRKPDGSIGYNPNGREVLHGDESAGLGTSTFLEGAPASRAAIQRRESEYESQQPEERPGLSRKKSLAQKIRGVRPSRDRFASADGRAGATSPPMMTGQSDSAVNPFFRDFNGEVKKDNAQITFDEQPKPSRARAPSSPKRNELERRNTTENGGEEGSKPTGLLGRMKSLKGGRRPVRRDTNS
ncbi:hypothetical protein PMZ80_010617 [Knufia obscura]|uniref:Uncharacterized protein n=1 Tax=Knufia obscura TaxID=1635080 RepID=A0ABR0R8Z6_9EURO|nr:hypothetical protein PMZ80_010617 [Knufia obscura]